MKKFSLKPLGGSCMKTLCKSGLFIGLLMAFCLAACSDDDDNAVAPIFPEKQNLICNSNDTREFTFAANTNWSLASSAIWCKFKTADEEEFVLSGTAGTQTVTLVITDDNMQVGNVSVAKLELTMGGQTIVIGEVTRSKVDYKLKVYDKEGNDITENGVLKVGYQEYLRFDVEANFRFAATNLPGWVELEGGALVGAVNKKVQGGLKIIENESREKYPVSASDENVITFSDEEGRAFHTIKLVYDGMAPEAMKLTRPSSNMYDWVVSLDGKSFTQGSGGVAGTGSSTTSFKNRLPFTVKTLEDKYHVVFVTKGLGDNNLYLEGVDDEEWGDEKWMRCEDEKKNGNISLIVNPFTPIPGYVEERVGYVLVFSDAELNRIGRNHLESTIIDGGKLVYEYEQANLVLQFTQKEVKSSGETQFFSAQDINSGEIIECTTYAGDDANDLKISYGVQSISEIKQPVDVTYVTVAFEFMNYECFYLDTKEKAERVIDGSGTLITVTASATNNRDVFMVVSGGADEKAMLVVRTSNVTGGGSGGKAIFTVTSGLDPINCTQYDSSLGDASYFKEKYEVSNIFNIKNPKKSMFISLNSSDIVDFKCYDAGANDEPIFDASRSIEIFDEEGTGKKILSVWMENEGDLPKTTCLVVTGQDGSKNMLFLYF